MPLNEEISPNLKEEFRAWNLKKKIHHRRKLESNQQPSLRVTGESKKGMMTKEGNSIKDANLVPSQGSRFGILFELSNPKKESSQVEGS